MMLLTPADKHFENKHLRFLDIDKASHRGAACVMPYTQYILGLYTWCLACRTSQGLSTCFPSFLIYVLPTFGIQINTICLYLKN